MSFEQRKKNVRGFYLARFMSLSPSSLRLGTPDSYQTGVHPAEPTAYQERLLLPSPAQKSMTQPRSMPWVYSELSFRSDTGCTNGAAGNVMPSPL